MFRQLRKLSQNPLVRRIAIWLAPIVIGWIMDRLSRQSEKPSTKSSKSPKKK